MKPVVLMRRLSARVMSGFVRSVYSKSQARKWCNLTIQARMLFLGSQDGSGDAARLKQTLRRTTSAKQTA
jgi:hypothetical protein